MQFLGSLGVDLWLLLAQVCNFLLLLFVLNKLIYKPLIKRIEADEQTMRKVELSQLALQEKEQQLVVFEKQQHDEHTRRAREIIREAEEMAVAIRETAERETAQEKQAVIAQIKQRLHEAERYGRG